MKGSHMRMLAIFAAVALAAMRPAAGQEAPNAAGRRFIEVVASGQVSMVPDAATLVFRIEDSSTSASDSLRICTERRKKASSDMDGLGIPGLMLSEGPANFFADSLADPEMDARRRVTCRLELAATLPLKDGFKDLGSKAAALIDASGRSGAFPVNNPWGQGHLFFRVDGVDGFAREACASGLEKAKLLAAAMASRMSLKLGAVLSLAEQQRPADQQDSECSFASLFSSCPAADRWIFDGQKLHWRKDITVRFAVSD